MRIKFVGEPAQHLPSGPIWEPGEEQDLADDQAAVYLRNANWQRVDAKAQAAAEDQSPATTAPAQTWGTVPRVDGPAVPTAPVDAPVVPPQEG